MSGKTLMFVLAVGMAAIVAPVEVNADLIISQYYEGLAGHGQAIELYNTGTTDIDLSQYKSAIYSYKVDWQNGSASAAGTQDLSGTLAPDAVLVLVHNQWFDDTPHQPAYITTLNSTTHNTLDFGGGNKSWVIWRVRDAAGDPLAAEEMTDGFTMSSNPWPDYVKDKSLVRNANVVTGYNGVPAMEWFDLGEWTEYSLDDVINANPGDTEYLGSHIPEPATMSLLALGGLGALIRRRR